MAVRSSTHGEIQTSKNASRGHHFFVWREFVWGAAAGAFGEGIMHPVDTIKTRLQSQAIFDKIQNQKGIVQMVRFVWQADGLRGDTLGSFVYVPCEVMKQRMQVQGTNTSWSSIGMNDGARKSGAKVYGYYKGMFHAGCSIWKTQGLKGLYAGYFSTLARDVPFAGLMVMFYEALKDVTEYGKQRWNWQVNNSFEGLVLGGLAGGLSAYLTTPLDVVKTRLQVQGSTLRYKGWLDAICNIYAKEGMKGMFRGSIPRITWYIPASALTFMAVEFLRDHFNESVSQNDLKEVARFSVEKKKPLQEVS